MRGRWLPIRSSLDVSSGNQNWRDMRGKWQTSENILTSCYIMWLDPSPYGLDPSPYSLNPTTAIEECISLVYLEFVSIDPLQRAPPRKPLFSVSSFEAKILATNSTDTREIEINIPKVSGENRCNESSLFPLLFGGYPLTPSHTQIRYTEYVGILNPICLCEKCRLLCSFSPFFSLVPPTTYSPLSFIKNGQAAERTVRLLQSPQTA